MPLCDSVALAAQFGNQGLQRRLQGQAVNAIATDGRYPASEPSKAFSSSSITTRYGQVQQNTSPDLT